MICASLLNHQTVHNWRSIHRGPDFMPSYSGARGIDVAYKTGCPSIHRRLSLALPPPFLWQGCQLEFLLTVSHAQISRTGLRRNTETAGRCFPWRGTSCQSIQRSLLSLPPKKDPLDASSIPTLRCRDPPASDKRQSFVFRPHLPTSSRTPTVT